MEYDPRRLFPFGLSPIPEIPSELASEVSSVYSYGGYDEESETTSEASEVSTEVGDIKSPPSIMYSGSCSSVKSNATLGDDDEEEEDARDSGKSNDNVNVLWQFLSMDLYG